MDATVTFKDGSVHVYKGVPDGTAPDVVEAQAMKEFNKPVASLSGGAAPVEPPKPGLMQRIKDAVIAPPSERDATLGDAVKGGILEMPQAIGQDFMENARALGHHLNPKTPQDVMDAAPIGLIPKPILDLGGMAMSPITGALKSVVGRPVEQLTGIKRDITGNVASALVPLGGEANAANDASKIEKATAALKPGAADAHAAGYVLPPKMISDKPGIFANLFAGVSGKIKTAQAAAEKNQGVTNSIAARELGLPEDAPLTEQAFQDVRAKAGQAYQAVKEAVPAVAADEHYLEQVKGLGGANSDAALHFPNTMKNQGITDLVDELSSVHHFPTSAGLEVVKELRSSATANLKAVGDRGKHMLGLAQRQAADAVDGLIERNIEAQGGDPALVQEYKDARQLIAKSYDVEGATNSATGDVNAIGLGRLASKGKPLTGGLSTIARAAQAFPQAMKAGVVSEPLSALDFFGAAALAAHGNPKLAGMMLVRPVARHTVLSPAMQERMATPGANALSAEALRRAPVVNAFHALAQEPQQ